MKVFIPTAGVGSRLGELTKYFNKAMIPIGEKPVISLIVEIYPLDTEFVIALGYQGDYIKQFLKLAYPEKNFDFVKINKYKGSDSGLGYTLKQCRKFFDQPFFFHANDTIIDNKFINNDFSNSTLLLKKGSSNPKIYRTASITQGKKIKKIFDKTEKELKKVYDYVGVAYIKDYQKFNRFLDKIDVQIGESDFFMKNPQVDLDAYFVDYWYDIGNIDQLRLAQKKLGKLLNLDKPNEAVYFINSRVVKFSTDKKFIKNRVKRANLLEGVVPKIVDSADNFYVYNYVPGELLAKEINASSDLKRFLLWAQNSIWKRIELKPKEQSEFENCCFNFYYEKTLDRLNLFYDRYNFKEKNQTINKVKVPSLNKLINEIEWSSIKQGASVLFHGDLHFENILKTDSAFTLLDWRQSFDGQVKYGDIYYDLAKLLHGFMVNHQIIKDDNYWIKLNKDKSLVEYDFYRKNDLLECEKILKEFVGVNGYDWDRVLILTALIFLNIAGLHHSPYAHFLYHLGKSMLFKKLEEINDKG